MGWARNQSVERHIGSNAAPDSMSGMRPRDECDDKYDDEDDDDNYQPSQRQRVENGALPSPYAAPNSAGGASQSQDEPEMYLSQTDNPNTPNWRHQGSESEPHLKHEKSVQDRVHGQLLLNGLLVAVMDTAEFQRLDRIKQLGGCTYVYPSTTHSRKEHSIGVAYLAGEMARHLQKQQPELKIDAADILCVELAGLVHDLGHGPFSHMFEHFMELVKQPGEPTWEHEEMSGKLLRQLIRENDIPIADYFDCATDLAEQHINFVVKLIEGLKDESRWPDDLGRGPEKRFLFDIVSNKRNGVDVDKLDYLVRDSMAAFGSSNP